MSQAIDYWRLRELRRLGARLAVANDLESAERTLALLIPFGDNRLPPDEPARIIDPKPHGGFVVQSEPLSSEELLDTVAQVQEMPAGSIMDDIAAGFEVVTRPADPAPPMVVPPHLEEVARKHFKNTEIVVSQPLPVVAKKPRAPAHKPATKPLPPAPRPPAAPPKRNDTDAAIQQFIAQGGKVKKVPPTGSPDLVGHYVSRPRTGGPIMPGPVFVTDVRTPIGDVMHFLRVEGDIVVGAGRDKKYMLNGCEASAEELLARANRIRERKNLEPFRL